MTTEQAKKLMRLHQSGYVIQVNCEYYDGTAREIYDEDCDVVFDIHTEVGRDLTEIACGDIKVSKPVFDWWNLPIS